MLRGLAGAMRIVLAFALMAASLVLVPATNAPTELPTHVPSATPTVNPTHTPTVTPSEPPTKMGQKKSHTPTWAPMKHIGPPKPPHTACKGGVPVASMGVYGYMYYQGPKSVSSCMSCFALSFSGLAIQWQAWLGRLGPGI